MGVVIIAALATAREVLVPITLAILLSFMLGPVVALLRRLHLPRLLAVLLAVVAALGLVSLIGAVIGVEVAQLADSVPRYADTVQHKFSQASGFFTDQLATVTKGISDVSQQQPAAPAVVAPAGPKPLLVEVQRPALGAAEIAERILLPALSPLATVAIVFVVAIFILLQREDLRDRLIRLFGSNDLHRTTAALNDAGYRLGRYYLSLLGVNTVFGIVIGTGLFFIGVPSPILWGICAGLLRFVPYIGAVGGAVFPILLAAAVDPGWTMVVETVGLFLLVEPVLGQVVEPMIYGRSTGLSPVSVVISAIFWGWIWGGIGLLLSMPLTLCLVVLGKHIQHLEFLNVLLGDQPALSPAESLYQRMLVGDTDEVLEQAEAWMKERSLAAYYDEVAIPGLQLAANDSLRGVLTERQLEGILESIGGVVVDLGEGIEVKAQEPPPGPEWADEARILCVAGRGVLDEAVCTILAQLLGRCGLRARVASAEAASRSQIGSLDLTGVRLVCLSHIEGSNSLTPLRYMIRRLRQRAPDLDIVAGLWSQEHAGEDGPGDERLRTAMGADRIASTLQAVLAHCLEIARSDHHVARGTHTVARLP